MMRFKVLRLNILVAGYIAGLSSAAWGDCLDSLQGSWELDMGRVAVGLSQERRDAVVQFRGPDPFMLFSFTANEMLFREFTGYEWRETQPWSYKVVSEQGAVCEIATTNEKVLTSSFVRFDEQGFCLSGDREWAVYDCYSKVLQPE